MSRASEKTKSTTPASARGTDEGRPRESHREFVEQIVIAFILAFLVRGFEAEAFVIPTGSMAPTLMGMHKDVACKHCGFAFSVNASEEFEPRPAGLPPSRGVQIGYCGNCRGPVELFDDPSFNGDRILVMKSLYGLPFLPRTAPERWNVVVFHYPEDPETNYIKRLVGLPDEDLNIFYGDILTRRPRDSEGEPFRLQLRPLPHQLAMEMNVWDDRNRPRILSDRPEWRRWQSAQPGAWDEAATGRYETKAGSDWSELRYRHLVPDHAQWQALRNGDPLRKGPAASLVTDYYAYNSGSDSVLTIHDSLAPHWVGDLSIAARVESKSDAGRVRLELIEGGVPNRCEIDLATGQATLSHAGQVLGQPVATACKGRGTHDLKLANVDGRLTLWVDGGTPFGDGVVYEDGSGYAEGDHPVPTEADLAPVAVAVQGAEVAVSDLVLKRDIYYTLRPGDWDYEGRGLPRNTTLSDPTDFPKLAGIPPATFSIAPGRYMMLGDNSPRSKDGRGWDLRDRAWDPDGRQYWEVPENLLIGKAFFVYWPHGVPMWPNIAVGRNLRLPFRPNVERMKWIR